MRPPANTTKETRRHDGRLTATTCTRLERVTIDRLDDPRTRKAVFFEFSANFGVDRVHVLRCDDQFFVDGGLGESWITNSVFGEQQRPLMLAPTASRSGQS